MNTVLISCELDIQERISLFKSHALIGSERQVAAAQKVVEKAIRKGMFGRATANVDVEIPLDAKWWIENQSDQDLKSALMSL